MSGPLVRSLEIPSQNSSRFDEFFACGTDGRAGIFLETVSLLQHMRTLTSGVRRRHGTAEVSIRIELRQKARPPDLGTRRRHGHGGAAASGGRHGRRRGGSAARRGGGGARSRLEGSRERVSIELERGAQPIAGAHLTHETHDPSLRSMRRPLDPPLCAAALARLDRARLAPSGCHRAMSTAAAGAHTHTHMHTHVHTRAHTHTHTLYLRDEH